MTGRPSRERLSSQVVLLLEDYGNRQIDPRTRLCMHPCVFVGVCQANVAAAAASNSFFIAIEICKSAPGIR